MAGSLTELPSRAHGFGAAEISTWDFREKTDVEGAVGLGGLLRATSCVSATAGDLGIAALVADGAAVDDYPTIKRTRARMSDTPGFLFPAGPLMELLLYATIFKDAPDSAATNPPDLRS